MSIVAIVFFFSLHVFRIATADEMSCLKDPPPMENGEAVVGSRHHGAVIWYRCNPGIKKMKSGHVECDDGTWKGYTPVCGDEREERLATTEAPRSFSSPPVSADICYCTYDYESYYIAAHVGNKPLNAKDKITKGKSITLTCRQPFKDLTWRNGLSFYGAVNLTCNPCRNWTRKDLPTCISKTIADTFLLFNNDMKILPEGIIEVQKRKNISFHCLSFLGQPIWNPSDKIGTNVGREQTYIVDRYTYYRTFLKIYDAREQHAGIYDCNYWGNGHEYNYTRLTLKIVDYEMQCPELETNTHLGNFKIVYEDGRRINSVAHYSCKSSSEKLIGASRKTCLENGKWSYSSPLCENMTCPYFKYYNGLRVNFTNRRFVNSVAKFHCDSNFKLIGENSLTCLATGKWSSPKMPTCKRYVKCNRFETSAALKVSYSNYIRIGSVATFSCSVPYTLVGSDRARCRMTGTWDHALPSCAESILCPRFNAPDALKVSYSNDVRIGSIATFSCLPSYILLGNDKTECLKNGSWKYELPICEESILCPRFNAPDVLKVSYSNGVRIGSIATFSCLPSYTLLGNEKAECLKNGSWKYELPICKGVSGCSINKTESPHLFADPEKEHYSFGELVSLSCSARYMLTTAVQRVMCLATEWSDPLPGCVKIR